MADDLLSLLARFHREVVIPDIERIVAAKVDPQHDEVLTHFDHVYQRFDRLESELKRLRPVYDV